MAVMCLQIDNRFPFLCLKSPIDLFYNLFRLRYELSVFPYMITAGRSQLDKGEGFDKLRMLFEEPLNCPETLRNTLSVINAVNADTDVLGLDIYLLQDGLPQCGLILGFIPPSSKPTLIGKGLISAVCSPRRTANSSQLICDSRNLSTVSRKLLQKNCM